MRLSSLPGKIALVLIIALVPLIGHIAATVVIVRRPGNGLYKAFWIAVVWFLPFGPDIYLVGQLLRRLWHLKQWRWIILATLLLVILCLLGLFALGNG